MTFSSLRPLHLRAPPNAGKKVRLLARRNAPVRRNERERRRGLRMPKKSLLWSVLVVHAVAVVAVVLVAVVVLANVVSLAEI